METGGATWGAPYTQIGLEWEFTAALLTHLSLRCQTTGKQNPLSSNKAYQKKLPSYPFYLVFLMFKSVDSFLLFFQLRLQVSIFVPSMYT